MQKTHSKWLLFCLDYVCVDLSVSFHSFALVCFLQFMFIRFSKKLATCSLAIWICVQHLLIKFFEAIHHKYYVSVYAAARPLSISKANTDAATANVTALAIQYTPQEEPTLVTR